MVELTKLSADRAHKLFQVLKKLELHQTIQYYNHVDDIYNAWRFAERNQVKEVENDARKPK